MQDKMGLFKTVGPSKTITNELDFTIDYRAFDEKYEVVVVTSSNMGFSNASRVNFVKEVRQLLDVLSVTFQKGNGRAWCLVRKGSQLKSSARKDHIVLRKSDTSESVDDGSLMKLMIRALPAIDSDLHNQGAIEFRGLYVPVSRESPKRECAKEYTVIKSHKVDFASASSALTVSGATFTERDYFFEVSSKHEGKAWAKKLKEQAENAPGFSLDIAVKCLGLSKKASSGQPDMIMKTDKLFGDKHTYEAFSKAEVEKQEYLKTRTFFEILQKLKRHFSDVLDVDFTRKPDTKLTVSNAAAKRSLDVRLSDFLKNASLRIDDHVGNGLTHWFAYLANKMIHSLGGDGGSGTTTAILRITRDEDFYRAPSNNSEDPYLNSALSQTVSLKTLESVLQSLKYKMAEKKGCEKGKEQAFDPLIRTLLTNLSFKHELESGRMNVNTLKALKGLTEGALTIRVGYPVAIKDLHQLGIEIKGVPKESRQKFITCMVEVGFDVSSGSVAHKVYNDLSLDDMDYIEDNYTDPILSCEEEYRSCQNKYFRFPRQRGDDNNRFHSVALITLNDERYVFLNKPDVVALPDYDSLVFAQEMIPESVDIKTVIDVLTGIEDSRYEEALIHFKDKYDQGVNALDVDYIGSILSKKKHSLFYKEMFSKNIYLYHPIKRSPVPGMIGANDAISPLFGVLINAALGEISVGDVGAPKDKRVGFSRRYMFIHENGESVPESLFQMMLNADVKVGQLSPKPLVMKHAKEVFNEYMKNLRINGRF